MIPYLLLSASLGCPSSICDSNSALKSAIDGCNSDDCGPTRIQFWDVSNVGNFGGIFEYKDISNLNLTNWGSQLGAQNLTYFFANYKGDTVYGLETFNLSEVTSLQGMFHDSAILNMNISNWDVSGIKDMRIMFSNSLYNGDISNWKLTVDNAWDVYYMFNGASIQQDFSNWPEFNLYQFNDDYPEGCLPGNIDIPCPYTQTTSTASSTLPGTSSTVTAAPPTESSDSTLIIIAAVAGGLLLLFLFLRWFKRSEPVKVVL